ncbi:MAG: DUF4860 domain-containing protein [Oscillospiraceae bacterium]|nr:DUF4860 domain-containing protein [Oscillospiraceae bacterium]
MREESRTAWAPPLLYAMMLVAALLLTVCGARLYGAITERREETNLRRAGLAYAQSKIASADESGSVAVADGPEGDLLLLREGNSGYETRIYLYQGALREELSPAGSALAPDTAQTICAASSFSVTGQTLLTITVDGVQALCCLRSEGGAYGE